MHAMRSLDDLLAASKWAGALSAEQLQRARTAILVRELQSGNYVCRKDDPSNVWVGVIDGLVKAENLSDTGKSVTFATFPANSWFGEGSILKREARKYNVIAVRDSRVALMPAVAFFRLLDTSIPFNRFIRTGMKPIGRGAIGRPRPISKLSDCAAELRQPRLSLKRSSRNILRCSNCRIGPMEAGGQLRTRCSGGRGRRK
jgi:CRP-like cAMP-binding protein